MSLDFCFECLMLLDLGLEVGWVSIGLFLSRLKLLKDPNLKLVRVSLEVLELTGFLQSITLLLGVLTELTVVGEDLGMHGFIHTDQNGSSFQNQNVRIN